MVDFLRRQVPLEPREEAAAEMVAAMEAEAEAWGGGRAGGGGGEGEGGGGGDALAA